MDIVNLILNIAQQLGVTLGVGAETVVLVAYVLAIRDGVIDTGEERFAHAVKRILLVGLALIVTSGVAISVIEWMSGRESVVLEPTYLFKILLIAVVLLLAVVVRGSTVSQRVVQGLIGATWYGLFMVHMLAPVASWSQLIILYVIWLVGFMLCWTGVVYLLKDRKIIKKTLVQAQHTAPVVSVVSRSIAPLVPKPVVPPIVTEVSYAVSPKQLPPLVTLEKPPALSGPLNYAPAVDLVATIQPRSAEASLLQRLSTFLSNLFSIRTRDQTNDDIYIPLILPNEKAHETVRAVENFAPISIKNTPAVASKMSTVETMPTRQTVSIPTPAYAALKKEIPLYPTPTASEPFVPPAVPELITKTVETHEVDSNLENEVSEYMPAIRIMPKTKEEVSKQARPTVVDIGQHI